MVSKPFAPVVLFWKCQPDYLAQNNVLMREIAASGKSTKCSLLAICNSVVKCSLLAWENWSLLALAKINALFAYLQMLAKIIRYPLYFKPRDSPKHQHVTAGTGVSSLKFSSKWGPETILKDKYLYTTSISTCGLVQLIPHSYELAPG